MFSSFFCKSGSRPILNGLQMFNFTNLRIVTKSCTKNVHKKKPPISRLGGGGLAEYPAVHLKEAILIPIVLLPVIPLQACTWLEYTCMWSCWNAHGWNTHGWSTHGWNTHGWNTDGLGTSVCAHTRIVSPSHSP